MDIIVENEIKDSDESKKDSGFDKARWTKPKYQLSLPHGDKHGHMTHRALLILHHTGELLRQQLSTSQLLQLNSTNKKCSHLHRWRRSGHGDDRIYLAGTQNFNIQKVNLHHVKNIKVPKKPSFSYGTEKRHVHLQKKNLNIATTVAEFFSFCDNLNCRLTYACHWCQVSHCPSESDAIMPVIMPSSAVILARASLASEFK